MPIRLTSAKKLRNAIKKDVSEFKSDFMDRIGQAIHGDLTDSFKLALTQLELVDFKRTGKGNIELDLDISDVRVIVYLKEEDINSEDAVYIETQTPYRPFAGLINKIRTGPGLLALLKQRGLI